MARASTSGRCPASWPSSGHRVEVFSGQPYPELDAGVPLTKLPSLDLYREPDPFRMPRPSEFRDWIDVAEWATMCAAGFPEPLTFTLRAARHLLPRAAEFDVVHDNQSLGYGLLQLARAGLPTVATVHHPIAIDRELELAAAPLAAPEADAAPLVRLHPHAGEGRAAAWTPSPPCRRARGATSTRHMGVPRRARRRHPRRHRPRHLHARRRTGSAATPTRSWSSPAPTSRSRAWCTCSRRWPSCAPSGRCRLTVVGSARPGGPAETTRDRLGLQDAVRFTGPVPEEELIGLMQRATVVAIPSLYEGFSLPAIEAMACGAPLVTTDAGALPEVVGTQGRAAGQGRRRRRADRGAEARARLAVARRAAGPGRPRAGSWRPTPGGPPPSAPPTGTRRRSERKGRPC